MEITYNVGELRALVMESSNEFKAKLGDGVESGNKSNNGKAYSDAKKRAKDYDGGLSDKIEHPQYDKTPDDNKTTLDYNPSNASKQYKDRIKAQAKGYTSVAEMNNGLEKSGDFSDGDNIYDGLKKKHEETDDARKDLEKSGLQAREWPDKTFERDHMFEGKKMKTIRFKKTEFITEGHMISKIPDEFKSEGSMFIMEDKNGNRYEIEWSDNKANIIGHSNKAGMNESIDRMKELMGYQYKDSSTGHKMRMNEDSNFNSTLNRIRELSK